MAKIIIIAAIGMNNELGKDNQLLWHLPSDLMFFKENTLGKKMVMGYNTFISLPCILPKRTSIVLTHHEIESKDVMVFNDLDVLKKYLNTLNEDVYIIGGANLFKYFLDDADTLLLTEIDESNENADVFFPYFDKSLYDDTIIGMNFDNGISYAHVKYERKVN